MSEDATQEVEATLPGGAKFRVRGSDILGVGTLLGVLLIGYAFYVHAGDTKEGKTASQKVIAEGHQRMADALEKSAKMTADAMRDVVLEQRRTTEAMREQNCLLAIDQSRRQQMVEFCKRIAR